MAMPLGITAFITDRTMGIAELARACEERGFHSLYVPEHTHLPVVEGEPPSLVEGVQAEDYARSLDPFVSLAGAATLTTSLRLGTGICLVAQHEPLALAKRIATLDQLSSGRFVFGMGFGWNRTEAAHHGVVFEERHQVAREHVLAMRRLWEDDVASFDGAYVNFGPSHSAPKPLQARLPVLIGGAANAHVFTAIAEYGDGWIPIGGAGIGVRRELLIRAMEAAGRDASQLAIVPFGTIPSAEKLEHLEANGATEVILRVPSGPASDMMATLDRYTQFL